MTSTADIPSTTWSAFQRDAASVADRAIESDILLSRRDGPDLVIGSADRRERVMRSIGLIARVLSAVIDEGAVRRRIADPAVVPWLEILSSRDRDAFAREFVSMVAVASDLGTLEPLAVLIDEWRAIALVHADPRLVATLRREPPGAGDGGPRPADD